MSKKKGRIGTAERYLALVRELEEETRMQAELLGLNPDEMSGSLGRLRRGKL